MTWAGDLASVQDWKQQWNAATDTVSDTYATTFIRADGMQKQAHATAAGLGQAHLINGKLNDYHLVAKTNLPLRIRALEQLLATLNECLKQCTAFKTTTSTRMLNSARLAMVTRLTDATQSKLTYLGTIEDGLQKPETAADLIWSLVKRRYSFSSASHPPLIGLDKGYWIEKDHPLHATTQVSRSLGALWKEWGEQVSGGVTRWPFFVWLEEKNYQVDDKTVSEPEMLVTYVRQADLHAYALAARQDGVVVRSRSTTNLTRDAYDTTSYHDGMATFVIAPPQDSARPIVYSAQHERGLFHHSSFLAGEKVFSAGMLRCDRGRITALSPKSGHYKPGFPDFLRGIEEFLAQRLMDEDAEIELDQFYCSLYKTRELKDLKGDQYLEKVMSFPAVISLSLDEFRAWANEEIGIAKGKAVVFYDQSIEQHRVSLLESRDAIIIMKSRYPDLFLHIKTLARTAPSVSALITAVKASEQWNSVIGKEHRLTEDAGLRVVRLAYKHKTI